MVTFVPISDPKLAEEMRVAGLLYCKCKRGMEMARAHWDTEGVTSLCKAFPKYFHYAVEE